MFNYRSVPIECPFSDAIADVVAAVDVVSSSIHVDNDGPVMPTVSGALCPDM